MRAHNIMEDIVRNYLDEMLTMRFDVCSCDKCKEDVMAYVLTRVPPKYVTTDSGAMHTLTEQTKVEQSSVILKELVNALRIIGENPHHEVADDREEAYQLLMKQIKLDRGVDFSQYRDRLLKRRIALRMRAKSAKNYADYLQILIHEPEEYEKLFDVLTINVSSFFRDQVVWEKLRQDIFPELINRKKTQHGLRRIRIWSAGCSSGQEPYSLAIMLYELLERQFLNIKVEIIATDIDKDCLRRADKGIFDKESLKGLTPYHIKRFFIPVRGEYMVVPHVKEFVTVKELNLIHDPVVKNVDMVMCRNVFIYFNRSLQEHLIMKFYEALEDDGYFVMGNSENLLGEARQVFRVIDSLSRIYQKIPTR